MAISMALYVIPKKKGRIEEDIYNNRYVLCKHKKNIS